MPGRLEGRLSLVTGAASGIGQATAEVLSDAGAILACADIDAAGAAATAAGIRAGGGRATAVPLDITSEDQWRSALEALPADAGPLRILVNAAGLSHAQPIADLDLTAWRRVMAVNLEGAVIGTREAIRLMRAHGQPSAIVTVTSVSGRVAQPGASAYCASKAALRMFTRVAALECRREGLPIRITSIAPGGVRTPMWQTMPFFQKLVARTGSEDAAYAALGTQPHARFADPGEIARAILFLASDDASFIAAAELVADNGDL